METNKKNEQAQNKASGSEQNKDHASQGHAAGTQQTGSATGSKEPTLRSVTTDSSRVHKHRSDDLPTGGNIR
ncbi:MAG TPA: hypothetical protein VIG72_01070 [Pontibacter sp.]